MSTPSNTFSSVELDVEDNRKETTSAADNTEKANGISGLSNAFSVLELDVEDDRKERTSAADNTEKANGISGLSNAFSVLELDVEDDRKETTSASDNTKKANGNHGKGTKNDKDTGQSLNVLEEEYKLPLVWIDLEMTGLNIEVDRILEIACVITDGKLTKSVEGPDLVIHQTKDCLEKMGEWCQDHHAASGLTERVIQSTITEKEAEQEVVEFVKRHVGTYTPLLAGNSIYVDFLFLKKYMPDLASLFSHVVVDVSSVKALCLRWFPRDNKKAPRKENKHRAMDDIKESIAELKYYKENVFKSLKSKKQR